ncbi:hypothetical protein LC1Nh_0774 [Candidatus Nanohalobium constans]|uniref:Uncharacterized protein n=2 Tax=Candidatus Nanohalobium constans TaxID=2565781 RepID=A0A5Q0UGB2_9ARCH|nr:hypothetical protein LC1Nh_0774 [Candidatus Nanohalobium constans]
MEDFSIQMKFKKVILIGFLPLLLLVVLLFSLPKEVDYGPEPVEEPEVDARYYEGNETLVYEVVDGKFTSKSSKLFFTKEFEDENYTLKAGGKTKKTSVWAEESFLGLSDSGIVDFPVTEGEKVAIISDGTDSDGDGHIGLEKGRIFLNSKYRGRDAMITYYSIINGTAYEMGVVNSSTT